MEKERPQINNKKQPKGARTTVPKKKRCLLSCRRYLDLKEIEMLKISDVLEDVNNGIITGFGIKAVEHKE